MDLLREIQKISLDHDLALPVRNVVSKYMLAIDSIKRINEQIVESTDFHELANLILYTVSGQFGSPNAFIVSFDSDKPDEPMIVVGIGDLEIVNTLDDLGLSAIINLDLNLENMPVRVADLLQTTPDSPILANLAMKQIELLVPISRNGIVFTLMGLGSKVTGKMYTGDELLMLAAMLDSISPIMSLRSKEFFDLFHSSRQAVFVLGIDLSVHRMNRSARALVGPHISRESSYLSDCIPSLNDVFPNDKFPGWVEAICSKKTTESVSHVRNLEYCDGGEKRYFEAFVTSINSARSKSYSLMLTIEDVTEKRAASKRLTQLQNSAERGQMLSSISHELNNHLGLLAGGLELAMHSTDEGDLSGVRRHLEHLQHTFHSATRFASELTGRTREKSSKVVSDLNGVINRCVKLAQHQDRFRAVKLEIDLSDKLPSALLDEDEVGQLVLNVLNNAADAIDSVRGSGVIAIRTYYAKQRIFLEVADDGPGIAPEIRDRLFKENLTTKMSGHGYGLTVSAQILKDHQAEYQVDSELGKGAVFTFSFPVYSESGLKTGTATDLGESQTYTA